MLAGALDQDDVERDVVVVLLATTNNAETVLVAHPRVEHDHVRLEIPDPGDGLIDTADTLDVLFGITLIQEDVLDDLLDGDVVIDD